MFWRRNKRPEGRAVDHLPHVTGKGAPPPELLDLPLGSLSKRQRSTPASDAVASRATGADALALEPVHAPAVDAAPAPEPAPTAPSTVPAWTEPAASPAGDLAEAADVASADAPVEAAADATAEPTHAHHDAPCAETPPIVAEEAFAAPAMEAIAGQDDEDAVAAELEAALAAVADFQADDDTSDEASDAVFEQTVFTDGAVSEDDLAGSDTPTTAAPDQEDDPDDEPEGDVAAPEEAAAADAASDDEAASATDEASPPTVSGDHSDGDADVAHEADGATDADDDQAAASEDGAAADAEAAAAPEPAPTPPVDPVREGYFHTPDGLELFYRDYAPQPADANAPVRETPVLCLHGLTRNGRDFEEVAPQIAALGRRVIVPDQRGRGQSDWDANPDHYQPGYYVGDMLGLLTSLEVGPVVVLGSSMGGLMAMMLASAQPGKVVAAIINDIGPDLGAEGLDRIREYIGGGPAATDWADAARMTRAAHGATFPTMRNEDAFWDVFARRLYRQTPDGRILLDYDPAIAEPFLEEAESGADLWPFFEALKTTPTLVIRGELSDLLGRDTVAKMRLRKLDLKTAEAPAVGHAPFLNEPEVWSAIAELLDAVP